MSEAHREKAFRGAAEDFEVQHLEDQDEVVQAALEGQASCPPQGPFGPGPYWPGPRGPLGPYGPGIEFDQFY